MQRISQTNKLEEHERRTEKVVKTLCRLKFLAVLLVANSKMLLPLLSSHLNDPTVLLSSARNTNAFHSSLVSLTYLISQISFLHFVS